MSKVTVAIPTYNRSHYLKEAIESVLAQTFQDYELLILDNASTDNTPEVAKGFKDERIRYVRNEINLGMHDNWNKALELAQGEYVIIFHDDDIMKPELLEAEVKILDKRKDVVLVGTNVESIDEKGERIKERLLSITEDIAFKRYEYIERWYRDSIGFMFPAVMLRRTFLKEHQLIFREEIGHGADGYLWYEINLSEKELYLIAQPLLNYRIHQGQLTSESYDYNQWRLFFRHTYKLIIDNQLNDLMPVFKQRVTHSLLHNLIHKVAYAHIDKKALISELEKLKNEKFWCADVKISTRIKLFLAANLPGIAQQLHRMKQSFSLFRVSNFLRFFSRGA